MLNKKLNQLIETEITMYHLIPIQRYADRMNRNVRTLRRWHQNGDLAIISITSKSLFVVLLQPEPVYPDDNDPYYWHANLIAEHMAVSQRTVLSWGAKGYFAVDTPHVGIHRVEKKSLNDFITELYHDQN